MICPIDRIETLKDAKGNDYCPFCERIWRFSESTEAAPD